MGKGAPSWKRLDVLRDVILYCLLEFSCLSWAQSLGTLLRMGGGVVMAKGSLSVSGML